MSPASRPAAERRRPCIARPGPAWRYVANLTDEALADMLATACGFRGSMAEYLFATVSMLESLGIHDRNLWALQEPGAERIEAAHGLDQEL